MINKRDKTGLIIFFIRWWAAGAVYFLIGWGTGLGKYSSIIDLVFFLGITIGVTNSFILNPMLKMLFNIGWHKTYKDSTFIERFIVRVKDISLGLITVILITLLYNLINYSASIIFNLADGDVFLPGEPIVFGLLYSVLTLLIMKILSSFSRK